MLQQDGRQAVAAPEDEGREGDGRAHSRRRAQDSRVLKHTALGAGRADDIGELPCSLSWH
jgi:hypothetical protein